MVLPKILKSAGIRTRMPKTKEYFFTQSLVLERIRLIGIFYNKPRNMIYVLITTLSELLWCVI